MTKVDTDKKKIEDLLLRGVADVLPSKEALRSKLLSGKRLRIYVGADPTGPELHIGHATNLILLEKLRALGHEAIVLFGDFTAMVGDPTDKDAARRRLSEEEVKRNMRAWKKQAGKVVDFRGTKNPAKIKRNSSWLKKLSFKDVIELSSHFTVGHMLERDMFERRMAAGKAVYLHEFFYPMMQGYDSVAMDVDVEVGGTDQTFNMLVGRTLQRAYRGKEKFIVATTLLEDPKTGKKLMSKSEGGCIALSDSPGDMFGKAMALPDGAAIQVFIDCTPAPLEEIREKRRMLKKGANPRDIKMELAFELVKTYHSEKDAAAARRNFVEAFGKKGVPDDAPVAVVERGAKLSDVLRKNGLVASMTEFRRLAGGGALRDAASGEKIRNTDHDVSAGMDIKVGKKRFLKIRIRQAAGEPLL